MSLLLASTQIDLRQLIDAALADNTECWSISCVDHYKNSELADAAWDAIGTAELTIDPNGTIVASVHSLDKYLAGPVHENT